MAYFRVALSSCNATPGARLFKWKLVEYSYVYFGGKPSSIAASLSTYTVDGHIDLSSRVTAEYVLRAHLVSG